MCFQATLSPIILIYVDQTACEEVSCLHGLHCTRFATMERLGLLSALLDINIAMLETNINGKNMGPYSHVIKRYTNISCVFKSQV